MFRTGRCASCHDLERSDPNSPVLARVFLRSPPVNGRLPAMVKEGARHRPPQATGAAVIRPPLQTAQPAQ